MVVGDGQLLKVGWYLNFTSVLDLLNPSHHNPSIHLLLSSLQQYKQTPRAMPSGKRKRVSSPTNGDMAPSPSAYSKKSRLNSGLASDAADKVDVVYELVGTDKNITRSLSESR